MRTPVRRLGAHQGLGRDRPAPAGVQAKWRSHVCSKASRKC